MAFSSWADFFAMGGYAEYVWSSFAITFVLLFFTYWLPRQKEKQLLRDIKSMHQRRQQQVARQSNAATT